MNSRFFYRVIAEKAVDAKQFLQQTHCARVLTIYNRIMSSVHNQINLY